MGNSHFSSTERGVFLCFYRCADYHKRAESHFFFDFPLVYGNQKLKSCFIFLRLVVKHPLQKNKTLFWGLIFLELSFFVPFVILHT